VDACLVICLPFWSLQARKLLRIKEEDLVVLLMPASRPQELRHVWPVLASAARQLLDKVHQRVNNLQVHFIVPSILLNQHHILEESFHKHGLTGCAKLWHVSSNHAMFPEGRVFAMIVNHKDVTLLACVVVPTVNLLVIARGDVRA
jgi:hypothetical protein